MGDRKAEKGEGRRGGRGGGWGGRGGVGGGDGELKAEDKMDRGSGIRDLRSARFKKLRSAGVALALARTDLRG